MIHIESDATIYRLETEKKLYIVHDFNDYYMIVSGSRQGSVKKNKIYPVVTENDNKTLEQEVKLTVAKLVNAKIASGYKLVKGDIDKLNQQVEMIKISTVQLTKLQKQLNLVSKKHDKAFEKYQEVQNEYDAIVNEIADIKSILGIEAEVKSEKETDTQQIAV